MINKTCPVCQSVLTKGLKKWHFVCKICRYEKAEFEPLINSNDAHTLIDEAARENGLRSLRMKNFTSLLTHIRLIKNSGGRLLEVGCAHGWFLDLAKKDFEVLGVEPDKAVFNAVSQRGLPVRFGYYPDALSDDEKFDIIVFNDVIEHIPAIQSILNHCHRHLSDDGLLVLNLPSSNGAFYKLSKLLARVSLNGSFERLWQKDLPSPHLHYFNPKNLRELIIHSGFETKEDGKLPTLAIEGLYERITYTGSHGPIARAFIYFVVLLSLPILKILPSDIFYSISQRKG